MRLFTPRGCYETQAGLSAGRRFSGRGLRMAWRNLSEISTDCNARITICRTPSGGHCRPEESEKARQCLTLASHHVAFHAYCFLRNAAAASRRACLGRGHPDFGSRFGEAGMLSRTIRLDAAHNTIGIRLGKIKVPS